MFNSEPEILDVHSLLSPDSKYLIPAYQRDYAWSTNEVRQLLSDIAAACFKNKIQRYHIGTLIIAGLREREFEVIDGQQRLTTLHLINAALGDFCEVKKRGAINLHYSTLRPSARHFMEYIYGENLSIKLSDMPATMLDVYSSIRTIWNEVLNYVGTKSKNDKNAKSSSGSAVSPTTTIMPEDRDMLLKEYIKNNVKIVKICVPEGTDLCRYFEISNSRGEQLDKHEILKARLIGYLNNDEKRRNDFSNIWNQCSDMANFYDDERNDLTSQHHYPTLKELLSSKLQIVEQMDSGNGMEQKQSDIPQKQSVIDFPNFLMLALRVFIDSDEIPLDDTLLLDMFHRHLKDDPDKIMRFAEKLSELRLCLDDNIIWSTGNNWHLGKSKSISNKQIYEESGADAKGNKETTRRKIALQTMFHSAYPSRNYKYWLFYALKNPNKGDLKTVDFWEDMARRFLGARYSSDPVDYNKIYDPSCSGLQQIDSSRLRYGNPVVFALKLFDYILWRNNPELSKFELEFSSARNSIEHFYPQRPVGNNPELCGYSLDMFGNLCLVSSSNNSRFTNNLPEAKCSDFVNSDHKSIKLKLMMEQCQRHDRPWCPNADASNIKYTINTNTTLAINVFNKYLSNNQEQIEEAVNKVFRACSSSDVQNSDIEKHLPQHLQLREYR